MTRLRSLVTTVLLIASLTLALTLTILVTNDVQSVQANDADQITTNIQQEEPYYLPLTDAPPLRDITQQRLAPLEAGAQ